MSENKHTPEPMFQYQFRQLATYENGRTPVLLTEAQYCRAKSCIDACAGMTSEQVSHGIVSASVFSYVVQQRDELLADKARLDFLDGNMRFKMGWRVGAAPVGNLLVSSVIQPSGKTTSIREAIDAAIANVKGEQ